MGNPGNYSSIQEAINNASDGDTIFIFSGTYYETINITKNNLTIQGDGTYSTKIDANNIGNAISISADNITIMDLTITNANNHGVYLELANDIKLSNCDIYDNGGSGVLINASNNNTIEDCIIESNGEYGILLYAKEAGQTTNNNIITDCEIYYNYYSGIRITNEFETSGYSSADNNQITNCEISDNGYEGKSDNDQAGLSISPDGNGKVSNTLVTNCIFCLPYMYNVHIEGQMVENNTFHHNNFFTEIEEVYDEEENIWHQQINETTGEGNYWSCYDEPSEGAIDSEPDGIIDTPYDVYGGNNQDLFPLAEPIGMSYPVASTNGPYDTYVDTSIAFDGTSSYHPDGLGLQYLWEFGNGDWRYGSTATYSYHTAGTYTVTLTVEDYYGLTSTATTTATITEEPEEPEEEPNQPPIASAKGPYYEFTDVEIIFDGSGSFDIDGTIAAYRWTFGDGGASTLMKPIHKYSEKGNYEVTLTVTDDDGETGTATTSAIISLKANNAPEKPTIEGTQTGHINTSYNFSANSTDPDGDMIQYIFNWSDGVNDTISPIMNSGEVFNTSHNWTVGGVYVVTVYAKDEQNATSDTESLKILIDAHSCGTLGYLVDKNGNGTYDVFYRESTGRETNIEKIGDEYYIDINNDDKWDYIYNFTTNQVRSYQTLEGDTETEEGFTLETKWIVLAIFVIAAVIFIIAKFTIYKTTKPKGVSKKKLDKKVKKSKKRKIKEKPQIDGEITETAEKRLEKIEDDIDQFLSEKEKKK